MRTPLTEEQMDERSAKRRQFGENLKRLRQGYGMTQALLASDINNRKQQKNEKQIKKITPQAVSSWERGHVPDLDTLHIVADIFGTTIDAMYEKATPWQVKTTYGSDSYRSMREIPKSDVPKFACEPLYFIPDDPNTKTSDEAHARWGIVSSDGSYFRTLEGFIPVSSLSGSFCTLSPLASMETHGYRISLANAKQCSKLYVLPAGMPPEVRQRLRGWYFWDEDNKLFIRDGYGFAFPEEQYDVAYYGYSVDLSPQKF